MLRLADRVYAKDIDPAKGEQPVLVAGWAQEIRDLGGIAFVIVRDRTGTLQVVVPKKRLPEALVGAIVAIPRESVVAVRGKAVPNPKARNGYEILPEEVEVLGVAGTPLPLGVVDKVGVEIETRLDNRFMDLRKPEVQAIFRVRSALVRAGLDYFHDRGFVQIHSPRILGASTEGGTDLFTVRYFEKDAYLSQSPQLYKQMMMATGLDRVIEVATYFRAEKHNTFRHLNEITAFDAEMAFVDSEEDVMRVLEGAIHHIWAEVARRCPEELALRGVDLKVPPLPFARVPYEKALGIVNESGKLPAPLSFGDDLNTESERILGDAMTAQGHAFYFITRYPEAIKPFYTYAEGREARAFDLEHEGLEVTSGAQREHRIDHLVARIRQKGLNPDDFESYLRAFRYGMPPHGGFGLGIDRLTMELLRLPNIREAVLFPRDRTRLSP
jgi:aspartyl-tRNA synthetase